MSHAERLSVSSKQEAAHRKTSPDACAVAPEAEFGERRRQIGESVLVHQEMDVPVTVSDERASFGIGLLPVVAPAYDSIEQHNDFAPQSGPLLRIEARLQKRQPVGAGLKLPPGVARKQPEAHSGRGALVQEIEGRVNRARRCLLMGKRTAVADGGQQSAVFGA